MRPSTRGNYSHYHKESCGHEHHKGGHDDNYGHKCGCDKCGEHSGGGDCNKVVVGKVRLWNQHPLHTLFNTPDRKAYVIENRSDVDVTITIGLVAWQNEPDEVYFVIPRFCDQTFFVNTGMENHHFLKIHDPVTRKVVDAKYLNPVYGLATIVGGHAPGDLSERTGCARQCQHHIQLQMTPGW